MVYTWAVKDTVRGDINAHEHAMEIPIEDVQAFGLELGGTDGLDDGHRSCAGVALWTPPRFKPISWLDWGAKLLHSTYSQVLEYFCYRNTGKNKEVVDLLIVSDLAIEIPEV